MHAARVSQTLGSIVPFSLRFRRLRHRPMASFALAIHGVENGGTRLDVSYEQMSLLGTTMLSLISLWYQAATMRNAQGSNLTYHHASHAINP